MGASISGILCLLMVLGEQELVDSLIDLLYSYLPRGEGVEWLIWKLSALENLIFTLFVKFWEVLIG